MESYCSKSKIIEAEVIREFYLQMSIPENLCRSSGELRREIARSNGFSGGTQSPFETARSYTVLRGSSAGSAFKENRSSLR